MNSLQNKTYNLLFTLLLSVLCFFLYHKSGIMDDAGMAAIVLNWLPLLIGIFTIIIYLLVRLFAEKWSWIVTLLGGIFNVAIVISAWTSV